MKNLKLWVGLLVVTSCYSVTVTAAPVSKPQPQVQIILPAKPEEVDSTTYNVLSNFAGSLFDFAKLVMDPQNPANIQESLLSMVGHWVNIWAEATRSTCQKIDVAKVTEIQQFVSKLSEQDKNKLLHVLLCLESN